jgi:riboflavin biosynthesis pyrimidine reductase
MAVRLLSTLLDRTDAPPQPALTPALLELYDGDLHFPAEPASRTYVMANFVATLDGAASFKLPGQSSGATVSASNPGDRFIMGLLRASADAILVGAHTLHDTGAKGLWIPPETYPNAAQLYRDYRQNMLGKHEYPLVVIASGSGQLDLQRAVFQSSEVRTLVITTAAGEQALNARGARHLPSLEMQALGDTDWVSPAAILDLLSSQYGVRRLLHEGGPTLFGEFLELDAVDEFFLTLAPQISGHTTRSMRPSLVEGVEFLPAAAPWFELLSVKQSGAYLYLRYRRRHPSRR